MGVNFDKLKDFFLKDAFIISNHARVRMFQRNISTEDIENAMANGK